jgi:hypothetical protein
MIGYMVFITLRVMTPRGAARGSRIPPLAIASGVITAERDEYHECLSMRYHSVAMANTRPSGPEELSS